MSEKAYQVIARRWRPKQFSELVGQDHVVRTLGNAIEMGRIAHAYLFVGPRGTGKTTSARLFAKSLNWEDGPSLDVPADSDIGQAIMDGRCLDVIEIDGASNNSVDQVRDLRDECQYAPAQCRFKIYVIDEVHMLSQQAFNALLKTLEEPPPHVKFVFATTESHKVLPTIVSRCQRFEFRSIPVPLIIEKLDEICKAESIEVEEEALGAIARMAMGGMRDAQSILDQMISFCGKSINQRDVLEVYGLASKEMIEQLADSLVDANYDEIIRITDEFSSEGVDFYRSLLDLSEVFRELLLACLREGQTKSKVSPEQCVRILDSLRAGEDLVKMGLSEKTNFEVTLFRAVESGRSRSIDQVIRRISGMIPDEVKKKRPDPPTKLSAPPSVKPETLPIKKESVPKANDKEFKQEDGGGDSEPAFPKDKPKPSEKQLEKNTPEEEPGHLSGEYDTNAPAPASAKETRQIKDSKQIEKRIAELPDAIRNIMEEKFKGDFVSIEKIDETRLI
jgi:DNA polymerase-3 subunit gamma/tau